MKKLSLIMAMVLVATIGGVYATWFYAEGNVAKTDANANFKVIGAEIKGEKGTLSIPTTKNSLTISIDQITSEDDGYIESKPYQAVLRFSGSMTFVFTPASINEDVVANGIDVEWFLSSNNSKNNIFAYRYDAVNNADISDTEFTGTAADTTSILQKFDTTSQKICRIDSTDPNAKKWTKKDDGSFEYVLTHEELNALNLIVLTPVELGSSSKHSVYSQVVGRMGNIIVNIQEDIG